MQLDPITIQVLWNRLVSLVDEAATGLLRTAYTPSVKEYHDFCCALFDRDANMMSHSTITTAGFLGIVPEVMRNFIERHPPDTLRPGDVLITNDPWLASGHLIDVSVAAPIYHHGHLVGFTLCIVHQLDMGGRMSTLESQDVYEEGLKIPVLKLYDEGRLNETVFEFLRANIRVPDKVIGDIRAQLVANHVCTQGLVQLLDEFALDGLEDLSREIVMRTERSLRRKIAELPDGIYRNAVRLPRIPGCSDDIDIRAAVIVDGDGVTVDFTGTSGEVGAAVNCTFNMTRSYTAYPFKLALDPDVPNNAGGLRPIHVLAPEGTVLNCRPPAATWGRTMVSQLLPEIMFGALEDVMPDAIYAANGGTPSNEVYLHGRHRDGRTFFAIANHMGGFGARAGVDGLVHAVLSQQHAQYPHRGHGKRGNRRLRPQGARRRFGGTRTMARRLRSGGGIQRSGRRARAGRRPDRGGGAPERALAGGRTAGIRPVRRPCRSGRRPVAERAGDRSRRTPEAAGGGQRPIPVDGWWWLRRSPRAGSRSGAGGCPRRPGIRGSGPSRLRRGRRARHELRRSACQRRDASIRAAGRE